ncbi:putative proliferating cell nuclear antigen, PCNA [Helianthus annuus]|uniref:Proliferating cell nuclear antigen, PCNA n=1 Tax=Helianthus annuus TaxID=4232 RepID=A0A9K3NGT9_HELAN|nr:putative proliferating cell nuclear antigen, PCNA [Helianthus annuus]
MKNKFLGSGTHFDTHRLLLAVVIFVTKEAVKFSTQGDFGRTVFSLHILLF